MNKAAGLLLSLICTSSWAVGLGELQMQSKLGEPMMAELQITGSAHLDRDQLRIGVPSEAIYQKLGVDRKYEHSLIRFTVDDQHRVTLHTHDAIKEPYLNIIIELSWPEGQLFREYTLLLDPS